MQQTRTAGTALPGMGGALLLSVLAHGLLAAAIVQGLTHPEAASSVGQRRGGLTVTVLTRPVKAATAAVVAVEAAAAPRPVPAQPRKPPRPVMPIAAPPEEAVETAQAVAALPASTSAVLPAASGVSSVPAPAQQAVPAQRPGARFASLFAPIISRPLGRGGWQAGPTMAAPPDVSAAMQREQAIEGLRQSLLARLDALKAQLSGQPLLGRCEIRVSLERQMAQLQCQQALDTPRIAPLLGSMLTLADSLAPQAADSCLQVSETSWNWTPCPASSAS